MHSYTLLNMKKITEVLEATKALFTFTPYTTMPRKMEIAYGIIAWFGVILIVCAFI